MEEIKLDISSESQRFATHLALPGNNKIIFSGIFGIGKTYFLKEFFNQRNSQYEMVYLSPVNYSVSQNEDIFECIKIDIAFDLLAKADVPLESLKLNLWDKVPAFIQLNIGELIRCLVENASRIQREIGLIYDSLKKLKDKFNEFEKEIQDDEEKELIELLHASIEKKGGIYEENRLTQLISGIVEAYNNKKETVLIVDDLDRIDPEHLFRIFNIFSCHFNYHESGKNKFSFSKIIFVGDVENFKNIYHHKYGISSDFNGYIDKFYSYETFNYSNKSIVDKSIKKILSLINFPQAFPPDYITEYILREMLYTDALNLRSLLRFTNQKWSHTPCNIYIEGQTIRNWKIGVVFAFDFLVSLYGNLSALKTAIEKCEKRATDLKLDTKFYPISFLLFLAEIKQHKLNPGSFNYSNRELNIHIEYEINNYGGKKDCYIKQASYFENRNKALEYFPFFTFLNIAFKEYVELRNSFD